MSKEDLERMKALEEKRDNCTITEIEEKELTYLIWKYTNQDFHGRRASSMVQKGSSPRTDGFDSRQCKAQNQAY